MLQDIKLNNLKPMKKTIFTNKEEKVSNIIKL